MAKEKWEGSLGCGIPIFFVLFVIFSPNPGAPNFLTGAGSAALKSAALVSALILVFNIVSPLFRTDKDVLADIEQRKKAALEDRIFIIASKVVVHWGKVEVGKLHFLDNKMEIVVDVANNQRHTMKIAVDGKPVFECVASVIKGISYAEPQISFRRTDEGFELEKEYGTSDRADLEIASYIPGRWVKNLQRLGKAVEADQIERQRLKEVRLTKERVQAERKKFGL
jgi:hypothetical protein